MGVQLKYEGYHARFYGPSGGELNSRRPISLTPERAAYPGWWIHQTLTFHNEGNAMPFMSIYKELSSDKLPGYRIIWPDSLGIYQTSLTDKLKPLIGLHNRLDERGYVLGKTNIIVPIKSPLSKTQYKEISLVEANDPKNIEFIDNSKDAGVKSDWLDSSVERSIYNRAVVFGEKYFGAEDIVTAFRESFCSPGLLTPKDFQQLERYLDDLIKDFPQAPKK